MKTQITKLNDPQRGNRKSNIYLHVVFEDDYKKYREFFMVVHPDVLLKVINDCNEIHKQEDDYVNRIYNETINLVFRPRIPLNDICQSIISYLCCTPCYQEYIMKSPEGGYKIIIIINVVDDEWSDIRILSDDCFKNHVIEDDFKIVGKGQLSMTLPSKLTFLREDERFFFFSLIPLVKGTKSHSCLLTYSQLWKLFLIQGDKDEKYGVERILDSLSFYDLIKVELIEQPVKGEI